MAVRNFNMKLDDELRDKVVPVLQTYGLTPAQAIKLFFRQIAETHAVPLSFDWAKRPAYENSATTMQAIEEARSGKLSHYNDSDALLKDVEAEREITERNQTI